MKKSELKQLIREIIIERKQEIDEMFYYLVEALKKAKVPCKVKQHEYTITVECGWNYPDKLANKIFDIAETLNIPFDKISVCAEESGRDAYDCIKIEGGPKRY